MPQLPPVAKKASLCATVDVLPQQKDSGLLRRSRSKVSPTVTETDCGPQSRSFKVEPELEATFFVPGCCINSC